MSRALAVLMSSLILGCSVPLSDSLGIGGGNSCSADSDCGNGATCAAFGVGRACVATNVSISGLLLEVRPAAGQSAADPSFIVDPGALAFSGGFGRYDVSLPDLVKIAPGTVQLDYDFAGCTLPQGTLPADATFTRSYSQRGLTELTYVAKPLQTGMGMGKEPFAFEISVPPGMYDIYITPKTPPGCNVPAPPPIFLQKEVKGDAPFQLTLDKPIQVSGSLTLPLAQSIDGWLLELVEPEHGHRISQPFKLVQDGTQLTAQYSVSFYYFGKTPILRLRPPNGSGGVEGTVPFTDAPTVYWNLDSAKLDPSTKTVKADFTLQDFQAKSRHVEGTVEDSGGRAVPSTVRLESKSLSGSVASNAAYDTTIDAPTAAFAADVPPGTYRVTAVPNDPRLPITSTEWQVSNEQTCYCGHVITVTDAWVISGDIASSTGRLLSGAGVQVTPSAADPVSFYKSQVNPQTIAPRQRGAVVSSVGAFSIEVDPGDVDVSIRPPSDTGYPWRLLPRIPVGNAMSASDLGQIVVGSPAVLTGSVATSLGVVPNALITAWLPVKDVGSVLPIGQATTDGSGTFTLLLPPDGTH